MRIVRGLDVQQRVRVDIMRELQQTGFTYIHGDNQFTWFKKQAKMLGIKYKDKKLHKDHNEVPYWRIERMFR